MIKDAIRGVFHLSPHDVPVVGDADELAEMSSPQENQVILGMDSKTWRNEVAPRARAWSWIEQ
jgi:hypothetical protein